MHSLQPIRWAVLSMLLIVTLLLPAQAAITLHYFAHTACNANTAISDYTNASPTGGDSACVAAPQNAVALYVDGIDEGCTIRTYSDAACASVMGLSITVGTCYFRDENSPIGSWLAVCGSQPGDPTVTLSLMSSPTMGTGVVPESSPPPDSSIGMTAADGDVGPVLTSTENISPGVTDAAPPTDGGPAPTQMSAAAGNGSNATIGWSLTHTKLAPTGSPGLQGTSVGTGTSGEGLEGWRKQMLKSLVMTGMMAGWWVFL